MHLTLQCTTIYPTLQRKSLTVVKMAMTLLRPIYRRPSGFRHGGSARACLSSARLRELGRALPNFIKI